MTAARIFTLVAALTLLFVVSQVIVPLLELTSAGSFLELMGGKQ